MGCSVCCLRGQCVSDRHCHKISGFSESATQHRLIKKQLRRNNCHFRFHIKPQQSVNVTGRSELWALLEIRPLHFLFLITPLLVSDSRESWVGLAQCFREEVETASLLYKCLCLERESKVITHTHTHPKCRLKTFLILQTLQRGVPFALNSSQQNVIYFS